MSRAGGAMQDEDGNTFAPPSYKAVAPDGSAGGGYNGLFGDRDSLDRATATLDTTLADRVRASIVRGTGATRNPDLMKLFYHIDTDGDGFIQMNELVVKLLSMENFQLSSAEAEAIFNSAARGRTKLTMEAWLDWCSGRTSAASMGKLVGPGAYGSPSCPSLGWRALAGVSLRKGADTYTKVAEQLRRKLLECNKTDLRNVFAKFDTNGNMQLDMAEFRKGLESLEVVDNLDEDQLFTLFKEVDADCTGVIDHREFMMWLTPMNEDPWATTTELAFERTKKAREIQLATQRWHD